jgi:thiol peroxidase
MPVERAGAVTFKGNPLTLLGAEVKTGDMAPNFNVLANDLSEVSLETDKGKARLLLSVPSLDTPVCDAETRRFNAEAGKFPDNVMVYTISCDLPFAQARWCGTAEVKNLRTLSDHRSLSFGEAYGTWIKELRLLSRAVFLVDENDTVRYVEYVREIGEHPNYDAVIDAVRKLS